jgi:hypothetical protein
VLYNLAQVQGERHNYAAALKLADDYLKHGEGEISSERLEQVRTWVQETVGVAYSISGIKDLLRRIGASYHKVSGFFWKADVEEQKKFVRKHRRHKRQAGPTTRRYFVDACHPVWGVDLLIPAGSGGPGFAWAWATVASGGTSSGPIAPTI